MRPVGDQLRARRPVPRGVAWRCTAKNAAFGQVVGGARRRSPRRDGIGSSPSVVARTGGRELTHPVVGAVASAIHGTSPVLRPRHQAGMRKRPGAHLTSSGRLSIGLTVTPPAEPGRRGDPRPVPLPHRRLRRFRTTPEAPQHLRVHSAGPGSLGPLPQRPSGSQPRGPHRPPCSLL